jgi:peptidoglycan/xylan/chitin deacetylase (PgdA/CDA1 family)
MLQAAALRAVQQGHDIGSHAAEHLDLTKLEPGQIDQQIAWGIGNISALTGSSTVPVSLPGAGFGAWISLMAGISHVIAVNWQPAN